MTATSTPADLVKTSASGVRQYLVLLAASWLLAVGVRCSSDTATGGSPISAGNDAAADAVPDTATEEAGCVHPLLCQQCGTSPETNPCYVCEDEKCCDTYAACKADPQCDGYSTCMNACAQDLSKTVTDCTSECDPKFPGGYDKFAERIGCIVMRCGPECGSPSSPCLACWFAECAESYAACFVDEQCSRLQDCLDVCAVTGDGGIIGPQCKKECENRYPPGDTSQLWQTCASQRCVDECL